MFQSIVYASANGNVNILADLILGDKLVQYSKLMAGTADSAAVIPGDAANGLDVDVTRVIPGVAATCLGKAEDAAHLTGDTGVMTLGVRNDTLAGLTDANGDYSPVSVTSVGQLWTKSRSEYADGTTILVTDEGPSIFGTVVMAYGGPAGTANALRVDASYNLKCSIAGDLKAHDQVHVDGEKGFNVLGVRSDEVTPGFPAGNYTSANGDFVPLSLSAKGEVWARISGVCPGTFAYQLGKAEDAAHASGDTGVAIWGVRNDKTGDNNAPGTIFSNNNLDYTPIAVTQWGEAQVTGRAFYNDGAAPSDTLNGIGLIAFSGTDAKILKADSSGNLKVTVIDYKAEDAAHVSGDKGVQILTVRNDGFATSRTDADSDYNPLASDAQGRLGAHAYAVNDYIMVAGSALLVKQVNFAITGADQPVIAAVSAKKVRIISIVFTCTAACTVTWKSASSTLINAMPFAANGGMDVERARGWFIQNAANNEAINASVSAGTMVGSACYVEVP